MSNAMWHGAKSRKIVKRLVVLGELKLLSPAHFGCGDAGDQIDMPLLLDPLEGKPLLPGASIAGALRSYLRSVEMGYLSSKPSDQTSAQIERQLLTTLLFGGFKGDDEGEQSPLIIDDSIGESYGFEIREGVKINSKSRTAEKDALYSTQFWHAGTRFPLRFELVIRENEDYSNYENQLINALATALKGFNDGITLGARKKRGFGKVEVKDWKVEVFDLRDKRRFLDWLKTNANNLSVLGNTDIFAALGVTPQLKDQRAYFEINATFLLDGSLLTRGISGQDDYAPDMVHLHTRRKGKQVPVLSGTSLAGALRARALKIVNTIKQGLTSEEIVNHLLGPEMKGNAKPKASRLLIEESVIENPSQDLVQSRVSIDRFTGGARDTALFQEQPVFSNGQTQLRLVMKVINPNDEDVGLMLLLLKDLWTGDLPLGGEISVGRGRLKGLSVGLKLKTTEEQLWEINTEDNKSGKLKIEGEQENLQKFVDALVSKVKGEASNGEKN